MCRKRKSYGWRCACWLQRKYTGCLQIHAISNLGHPFTKERPQALPWSWWSAGLRLQGFCYYQEFYSVPLVIAKENWQDCFFKTGMHICFGFLPIWMESQYRASGCPPTLCLLVSTVEVIWIWCKTWPSPQACYPRLTILIDALPRFLRPEHTITE